MTGRIQRSGLPQPLAGSVAGLGFVYYQNNGVTVAPPASPNLVRYIATQFTVTFGGANTAYRATVTMRPL